MMNLCADKFELNNNTQMIENIVSSSSEFVNDHLIDEIIDLMINDRNETVNNH